MALMWEKLQNNVVNVKSETRQGDESVIGPQYGVVEDMA